MELVDKLRGKRICIDTAPFIYFIDAYSADSATRFRRNPPPCSDSSRQGVPIDSTTPGRSVATLVF